MAGISTSRRLFRLIAIVGLCWALFALVQPAGGLVRARELEDEEENCFKTVSSWSEGQLAELSSLPSESSLDHVNKLRDLLFYLHIPRTGGRTLHQCFLKHIVPAAQRCPRSYDVLRINRSQPGCRLISTHDDYSLVDKLPLDMTSVVTTLRAPVDRVLSSYEFSIEVAARALRTPTSGSVGSLKPDKRVRKNPLQKKMAMMSTYDIWPWKYLVPTMEQDLFARKDARKGLDDSFAKSGAGAKNVTGLTEKDSYDAALIAMPFEEFIRHPVVHELVHNGATFQVAGLTNISFADNAGAIRRCVIRFPSMGKLVVEVAKKRLDRMLYVGLTERQNQTALYFAKVLGDQVSTDDLLKGMVSELGPANNRTLRPNSTSLYGFTKEEAIQKIMETYEGCVAYLRKSQVDRRTRSLGNVSPIKFSRERRKLIPEFVMAEVARVNQLDQELYAHARIIFSQQQKNLHRGEVDFIDFADDNKISGWDGVTSREGFKSNYAFIYNSEALATIWGLHVVWLIMIPAVLLAGICYVTKRRVARVKET